MDLGILDSTSLRIAGAVSESIVDGPGIRYTIFTQGCLLHCKECHNPQSQPLDGGIEVSLRVLYNEIKENPLIKGVTYSGGEPFLQVKPLIILSKILKEQNYSLWSYSGYTFDKLAKNPQTLELLKLLDVIVDGPFVDTLKSYEIDFRGSTNQRIIDVQRSLQSNTVVKLAGYR
ncbi:Pyruvate formate-lyase 1-activating enzyme [Anaerobiospirillum thomasii]|uniref:anaerobic ribonucleoside-triphosphate reductase activating protein n=1 Tax=Anaerobiospirillum thomasii TaxID=179995 RepID=UPI000D9830D4|nr:anaerobic ribonucleoside-triphosphate reductase activating protein [Anaerobiospirillum thomasii]SPT72274.1 Pyruvate formate-lyase 1-activating enzyme [Anaerobiospirillum thomasii]